MSTKSSTDQSNDDSQDGGSVVDPVHHVNDNDDLRRDDTPTVTESDVNSRTRSQDEIVSTTPSVRHAECCPTGCCTKLVCGIRRLWATHQMRNTKENRELHVKTTLRELIIHLVFLIVVCIVTFTMTSTITFYYTDVMRSLFVDEPAIPSDPLSTFAQIDEAGDWYNFAEGPLLRGLYPDVPTENQTIPEYVRDMVLSENRPIGVPRIRQVRVRNDSCVVHPDFRDVIKTCYGTYSSSAEQTTPYGLQNGTAWRYQTSGELDGSAYWGIISTYGGGGYVQDLSFDGAVSNNLILSLQANSWIDRGTRAVFVDFSLYNANINLFCIVRLLCEFPPTGGVIPSWSLRTVKLIRYVNAVDYFVLACEIAFIIFVVYYIVEEALELKHMKLSYLKSVWSWLDIAIISASVCCIAFNVYRTVIVNNIVSDLSEQTDHFGSLFWISYWQLIFNCTLGVTVFLTWLKVFKFISFNKTMTQLASTLSSCAKDITGFAFMFFIVFLAFAQLGYLIFGTQVADYASFEAAIFTQFCIILGDFNFHELESANRVLGPMYFILYVFFVFFVLLNMFLAIINDTYSEVKAELSRQKNEFEIADYFKRGYQKMLDKLSLRRDKVVKVQKSTKSSDSGKDKKVDFAKWRADLIGRGYAQAEIVAVISKYDLEGCRVVSKAELRKVQDDLDKKKFRDFDDNDSIEDSDDDDEDDVSTAKSSVRRVSTGVSHSEFTVLQRRVDRMEHSIGSIVSKIDAVLVKLDSMEKVKARRKETVNRLLDGIAQSEGVTDESKCAYMERLVRDELERWESESSISGFDQSTSSRGRGSGRGQAGGTQTQDYSPASNA